MGGCPFRVIAKGTLLLRILYYIGSPNLVLGSTVPFCRLFFLRGSNGNRKINPILMRLRLLGRSLFRCLLSLCYRSCGVDGFRGLRLGLNFKLFLGAVSINPDLFHGGVMTSSAS